MKLSKQRKSLFRNSILLGFMMVLLSFQCTSNKKGVTPVLVDPGEVVDTVSNPNNSSPNLSENEAKLDSVKRAQEKKKKN